MEKKFNEVLLYFNPDYLFIFATCVYELIHVPNWCIKHFFFFLHHLTISMSNMLKDQIETKTNKQKQLGLT